MQGETESEGSREDRTEVSKAEARAGTAPSVAVAALRGRTAGVHAGTGATVADIDDAQ